MSRLPVLSLQKLCECFLMTRSLLSSKWGGLRKGLIERTENIERRCSGGVDSTFCGCLVVAQFCFDSGFYFGLFSLISFFFLWGNYVNALLPTLLTVMSFQTVPIRCEFLMVGRFLFLRRMSLHRFGQQPTGQLKLVVIPELFRTNT